MKTKVKKTISIMTCLVMLFYLITPNMTYALENGKPELSVTTNKQELKRGEEVEVTVNINTNSVSRISALQIELAYNKDVFEPILNANGEYDDPEILLPDFTKQAMCDATIYQAAGTSNFMYSIYDEVTEIKNYNGGVYKTKLRVKEDAKIGKYTFEILTDLQTYPVIDVLKNEKIESTFVNAEVNVISPLESISLTSTSSELWVGDTANLTVKYTPEDTTEKGVTYKSSDDKIATVSTDGIVTAVGKGTATITATGANNITSSVTITVKQPVTGVTLNKTTLDLEKDQTEKLVATVLPENADGDKTVTWKSSNNAVATVSTDGTVTALGKGSCDITVTTQNGKTATCKVTVGVPLKSISFKDDITSKTINKGEEFTLEVVYNPTDTDIDKTITWSSTDTSVATVENGKVTAIGGGETEIKATTVNGLEAICKVKVEVPLTSISIKTETSIQFGQTEKLIVAYNPVDTTADKTIAWSSEDENIAKISTDGTIKAIGVGETTVTAQASNGQKATCKVTVLPVELNSISITEQNIVLNKGENKTLSVTYNPENTTEDKTVTWESSNKEVVTVSENGVITAVGAGNATITAKVGEKIATTQVEVKVPLQNISLNETEKQLNKGDNLQLTITYNPEDTTANKTVTWTSTDNTVATVDENGNVTALKAGTTYIKAKVEDKEVSCKIDVVVPLTGINLNKNMAEILKGQTEKLTVTLVPEDTTYTGKVEWTSSDETIATVDENGNVKGIKDGTVIITAKAVENGKEIIATSEVTIREIPLNSIEIDISDFDLEIGKTEKLNIICNPENTTDDINVEWTSSNKDIATIDNNGVVTAVAEGTTVITATVGEKTASIEITVKAIPITSIEIDAPVKVLIGGNFDVKITVKPENATYDMSDIKLISSNSDVLFVNEDGTILAKGLGKAILTAETKNGVKTQTEIEVVDSTVDYPEENPTDDVEDNEENDNKPSEDQNKPEEQKPIDNLENEKQEENKSNSPKTGDIQIEMLITVMIISAIGIVIILRKKLKK